MSKVLLNLELDEAMTLRDLLATSIERNRVNRDIAVEINAKLAKAIRGEDDAHETVPLDTVRKTLSRCLDDRLRNQIMDALERVE